MRGKLQYSNGKTIDEGEAIESLQQKQFVGLTVFMREDDKEKLDPKIYVEQSIIQDGKEKLIVHELNFRGLVQTGIEYMFRGLGDEHPEFGKGDLRVRFLSVSIYPLIHLILHAPFSLPRSGKKDFLKMLISNLLCEGKQ